MPPTRKLIVWLFATLTVPVRFWPLPVMVYETVLMISPPGIVSWRPIDPVLSSLLGRFDEPVDGPVEQPATAAVAAANPSMSAFPMSFIDVTSRRVLFVA